MKQYLLFILSFLLFVGCASTKQRKMVKEIRHGLNSKILTNQFTGFFLIDAATRDTLFDLNGQKYFTPASNTKIFTLFTGLNLISDSIPSFRYLVQNDTFFLEGTGDPTLLHPYFHDSTAIKFLAAHENIALYTNNFKMPKYGPGWAWDDFAYYYQTERSGFPIYGNVNTIYHGDSLVIVPSYFKEDVIDLDYINAREESKNTFYYGSERKDTLEIPFRTDSTLTRILLGKAMVKKITITNHMPIGKQTTVYSIPSDSLFKRMMLVSDNFLAEQILILAAATLSDTLDGSKAQSFVLNNQLADLNQAPRWEDGSGLSRYNLFTPESMVHVLYKLYTTIPKERLFNFFPIGGVNGTLKDWYSSDIQPYIYAKSGSLGNNYCLSGYLLTKSGKTLIFSYMNNHFVQPSGQIKQQMQHVLEIVRDGY